MNLINNWEIIMKKLLFFSFLCLGAFSLMAMTAFTPTEPPPPKKVWVCHFPGHTADFTTPAGTQIDGDYILVYQEGMPLPNQVALCEGNGGNLINIAATAAVNGHDAQFPERIDNYPDR